MPQIEHHCLSQDGDSNNSFNVEHGVLTYRQLRERGWSRQMVTKHLGSADCHTVNPHVGSGRPMRLFLNARVLSVEQMETFRADREMAKERSASAVAVFNEKTLVLNAIAESIEIAVPKFSTTELRKAAQVEFGSCFDDGLQLENELSLLLQRSRTAFSTVAPMCAVALSVSSKSDFTAFL